ncbi:hypothetical protein PsYK624_153700 [Phanerochaete sordida]|uniref:Uncharacterized protein n=1 Tax=Phanerochaete sordida TaxID=48140 RepID=A0A9P3GT71_9APHY|nr:hypothetical protein PsYK624_153700 [Phanerochaete sordida]
MPTLALVLIARGMDRLRRTEPHYARQTSGSSNLRSCPEEWQPSWFQTKTSSARPRISIARSSRPANTASRTSRGL